MNQNPWRAIGFRRAANIAQISYSKNSFVIAAQGAIIFPNIRHLQSIRFAQSASNGAFAYLGGHAVFVDVIKNPRRSKCGEMMALRLIEPKDPVSIYGLTNARNAWAPKL
jgi:hypothetical protein